MSGTNTYLDDTLQTLLKIKCKKRGIPKDVGKSGKFRGFCREIKGGRETCLHLYLRQGGGNMDVFLGTPHTFT